MSSTQIGRPLIKDQNKSFVQANSFLKYLKLKPKKERRALQNNNEQTGPLIDHIDETVNLQTIQQLVTQTLEQPPFRLP